MELFLNGKLSGAESRGVRLHLASCALCAATLSASDRIEIVAALDDEIAPSPDLHARFLARLDAHRTAQAAARKATGHPARFWWSQFLEWSWARQLAAAGTLAAFLSFGLYFGIYRKPETVPGQLANDIVIAENLSLLRDMRIIENLDLLEDFDTIQTLAGVYGLHP